MDLSKVTDQVQGDLKALAVKVFSKKGRVRRNGPCLCGSGKKYKRCCRIRVRAGEIPPPMERGRGIPTVRVLPTRKLRYRLRKALKELRSGT